MSDSSGMAEIRGLDIQKTAVAFAEEAFVFKNYMVVSPTSAREIRWYKKTHGTLDSVDTTGITTSQIANTSQLSLPTVVEQSWTRVTSYVRKYFVESPWMSDEDLKDSDLSVLATNVRDLTLAVAKQVDTRIWQVLTENEEVTYINTGLAVAGDWSSSTANPIADLLSASKVISTYSYDISNLTTLMHPTQYKNLLTYLITTKGSSVPAFASSKVESGVLMNLVGHKIVVSNNVTNGKTVTFIPNFSASWKSFMPLTTAVKTEEGIGKKIRIWEEGEGLLEHPRSVYLLSGCGTT